MAKKKTKHRSIFKKGGHARVKKNSLSIGRTYAGKIPVRR